MVIKMPNVGDSGMIIKAPDVHDNMVLPFHFDGSIDPGMILKAPKTTFQFSIPSNGVVRAPDVHDRIGVKPPAGFVDPGIILHTTAVPGQHFQF